MRVDAERRRLADPQKHAAAVRRYERRRIERDAKAYVADKAKWCRNYMQRQRDQNSAVAQKTNAKNREWKRKNAEKIRAYIYRSRARYAKRAMDRYAAKLKARPAWADKKAIEAIYEEARRITLETGIEHHVDHIVPLRGRSVSGLHWEGNLRVVPASVNRAKYNRLEIEEI
jgi:hypothetical protein